MDKEGFMRKKYKVWIFWALMLIGALLVVSQSSYSDGDDAFFYTQAAFPVNLCGVYAVGTGFFYFFAIYSS